MGLCCISTTPSSHHGGHRCLLLYHRQHHLLLCVRRTLRYRIFRSLIFYLSYMLAALLAFRLWKLNTHILPQQLRHSALPVLHLVVDAALLYTLTLGVTLICLLVNTNAMAIMIELVGAYSYFPLDKTRAYANLFKYLHPRTADRTPNRHNFLWRHHSCWDSPLIALYLRVDDRRKRLPQHCILSPTNKIAARVQGRCEQSQLPLPRPLHSPAS